MATTIVHYGTSTEQFGWLLNDVPKACQHFGKSKSNELPDQTNILRKRYNKLKITHLFRLELSYTPSPCRTRLSKRKHTFASNTWPSPRLSHTIEVDDNYEIEEPRYQFFKVATDLDNRLEDISFQTSKLQKQTETLKEGYEELENTTNQLLINVRHLITEIQIARNLEDLIRLLDDKTEHISTQKWPFVMAHSSPLSDMNLII